MGEFHYFLGVDVEQHFETGKIWIGQPQNALENLD